MDYVGIHVICARIKTDQLEMLYLLLDVSRCLSLSDHNVTMYVIPLLHITNANNAMSFLEVLIV